MRVEYGWLDVKGQRSEREKETESSELDWRLAFRNGRERSETTKNSQLCFGNNGRMSYYSAAIYPKRNQGPTPVRIDSVSLIVIVS